MMIERTLAIIEIIGIVMVQPVALVMHTVVVCLHCWHPVVTTVAIMMLILITVRWEFWIDW